jgi:uncharacterized protein (DUF58 family)
MPMDTTELLKKVRRIEIKTRGITQSLFSGEYHSAFKGRGMSFSEVREYQMGDDIRSIDWNVTARFNHPYVKVFEEERELTLILLVDVSGSEYFGTQKQLKEDMITELCAVLAFSGLQNNDKIGVIFFTDIIEKFIPPKKGKSHILRIIRELLEFKPKSTKTDITQALKFLTNAIKKRSIAFMISDFMDGDFTDAMKIASRKHDLIALRIYDKREKQLPNVGLLKTIDPETEKITWLDTSSKKLRMQYAAAIDKREKSVAEIFRRTGVDTVSIATDESYMAPLSNLLKKRSK